LAHWELSRHGKKYIRLPRIIIQNFGNQKLEMLKKGKAIPLQAWTGPEGSRRLRVLDFKIIGT